MNRIYTLMPFKCEVKESPPPEEEKDGGTDENLDRPPEPFHSGRVPSDHYGTDEEVGYYGCLTSETASPRSHPISPNRQSPPTSGFVPWPTRSSKIRMKRTLRRLLPAPPKEKVTTSAKARKLAKMNLVSFRCHSCEFVTRNKKLLNYHVNQTHVAQSLQGKPFSCQYCRYRCKSPTVLNVHVESVHYTDTLIDKIANK